MRSFAEIIQNPLIRLGALDRTKFRSGHNYTERISTSDLTLKRFQVMLGGGAVVSQGPQLKSISSP